MCHMSDSKPMRRVERSTRHIVNLPGGVLPTGSRPLTCYRKRLRVIAMATP